MTELDSSFRRGLEIALNFAEVRKSGILNISEVLVVLVETADLFTNLSTLGHTQSCT